VPDREKALRSKNLLLQPILPAHARLLFEQLQAPELYTFIPRDPPKSVAALAARYKKLSKRTSPDGSEVWLNYAIFNPRQGVYLGTAQATCLRSATAFIAYEVFPHLRRRGVATEACATMIAELFLREKVEVVNALVDTRNEASWRLLETLGFRRKETLVGADHFKGASSDEYRYELDIGGWKRGQRA